MVKCVIVMGVAGSGKTTVGRRLSSELRARFEDADDYHSQENRAKMARGVPLNDEDRRPWLRRIAEVAEHSEGKIVIACSALKRVYRTILSAPLGDDYTFIYLNVDRIACFLVMTLGAETLNKKRLRLRAGDLQQHPHRLRRSELERRLRHRKGHFFDVRLLDSQLDTLEVPQNGENCITVDANRSLDTILSDILSVLST